MTVVLNFKRVVSCPVNMVSIVTGIFEATIGTLINKIRDGISDHFKDGDVFHQKIKKLIARELHDIDQKLDMQSTTMFKATISYVREGLIQLPDVMTKCGQNSSKDHDDLGQALALPKTAAKMDI